MPDQDELTFENHLQIDERMNGWSPQGLVIGMQNSFPVHGYAMIPLSYELNKQVPEEIQEMYNRTKSVMSYGIYYYPIFTFADEELFRIQEAAISTYLRKNENCPSGIRNGPYAQKVKWIKESQIVIKDIANRLDAGRRLRNMVSHKSKENLLHPNQAITMLAMTKVVIEAFFVYGPPNFGRFAKRD